MPRSPKYVISEHVQFWILVSYVLVLFVMGGSARDDIESSLLFLPLSILVCGVAFVTLRFENFAGRKWLAYAVGFLLILCSLHVLPLPRSLWLKLPGREMLGHIDYLTDIRDAWRPLSIAPSKSWHALASLSIPTAVLLLGVQLSKVDLYRLLPVLLGIGVLSGFLSIFQIMGDMNSFAYLFKITNNGAAVGFFANRNHAAVLLACLLPMLAVYASMYRETEEKNRTVQLAAFAVGLIIIPLILVTGSRSGMLAAVSALVVSVILYHKRRGNALRRGKAGQWFDARHFIASAAAIALTLLTIYFSRAEAIDRLLNRSIAEDGRSNYWLVGTQMVGTYFPIGAGSGSVVQAYQIQEPLIYLWPLYVNHMHNDWLENLVTLGLPAFVILLLAGSFFLASTVSLWRRHDGDRRAVKIARLASALVGIIAIASVTDYPLRTPSMMAFFAILCLWLTTPALAGDAPRTNGD